MHLQYAMTGCRNIERVKLVHVRPQEDFLCHCHIKYEKLGQLQGYQFDNNIRNSTNTLNVSYTSLYSKLVPG